MREFLQPLEQRTLFSAGLVGQYFDNPNFTGLKLSRTDSQINADWGSGSPDKSIAADSFSIRWNGYVKPTQTKKYTFATSDDDGVRLWVNGQQIINQWKNGSATNKGSINLSAGKYYAIRVEYFENTGKAKMKLSWATDALAQQVIPSAALFTAIPGSSTTPPPVTPPPPPVITPPPPTSTSYDTPIRITHGGTYQGNWESDDPSTPAVIIATTDPVIITNSSIRSRGPLIQTWVSHTNLTVQSTDGTALNPNVAGQSPGRFLDDDHFDNIVVQNCTLNGTSGIVLDTYAGDGSSNDTIKILNNTATNIDGRHSDGAGGFVGYDTRYRLSDGHADRGYDLVQFLQIGKSRGVSAVEVAGNHILNQPGKSRVEDTISIFLSSGTSDSPIRIHDNYINGAFNVAPWQTNYSDGTFGYTFDYSGGGIMLGDGDPTDSTGPCAYVQAYSNTIIDTTNYGIAITSGHDLQFFNNFIYSSGKLSDGRTIAAQNVGAAIWDANGQGSGAFYNDGGHDNQVNWLNHGTRNDWWVPSATNWDDNVHSDKTPA